jgi:hypothetical protein
MTSPVDLKRDSPGGAGLKVRGSSGSRLLLARRETDDDSVAQIDAHDLAMKLMLTTDLLCVIAIADSDDNRLPHILHEIAFSR